MLVYAGIAGWTNKENKMKMTPREALEIQASHIKQYSRILSNLSEIMANHTDVKGINLDEPMDILEINKRIPRGCDIGYIIGVDL